MAIGLMVLSALPLAARASADVAGVKFEDNVVLGGQTLVLNGVGLRKRMIIKVYAVGLYLAGRESSAKSVLGRDGAKSVRIVMLRQVSGADLSESLVSSIVKNLSPSETQALQSRLDQLQGILHGSADARKGDVIELNYLPGVGTQIMAAGKQLGRDIAGEDFYRGLLKIWLGEKPSDEDLKAGLLGVSAR